MYGHVVASDILDEAYVVPLESTFQQINTYLGVKIVKLPTTEDFQKWRSRRAPVKAPPSVSAQSTYLGGDSSSISVGTAAKTMENVQDSKILSSLSSNGLGSTFLYDYADLDISFPDIPIDFTSFNYDSNQTLDFPFEFNYYNGFNFEFANFGDSAINSADSTDIFAAVSDSSVPASIQP